MFLDDTVLTDEPMDSASAVRSSPPQVFVLGARQVMQRHLLNPGREGPGLRPATVRQMVRPQRRQDVGHADVVVGLPQHPQSLELRPQQIVELGLIRLTSTPASEMPMPTSIAG